MSSPDQEKLLTPGQRRVMGYSLTLFAGTMTVALLISFIIVLGRLLGQFSGVLWPVAVAGVIALILRPSVNKLEKYFGHRRTLAIVVLYVFSLLIMAGALVLVLPPLARQILDLYTYLPLFWANLSQYVTANYPEWVRLIDQLRENPAVTGVLDSIQDQLVRLPSLILPSLKVISTGVLSTVSFFTQFAVFPVYLFFFLLSRSGPTENLWDQLVFIKPELRKDLVFLINEFIAIVVSFFRGQIIIALSMGVLFAIGFTVVGLKFGLIIGLMLGVLNIVPYLGTIVGLGITIPLAFFQPDGGITRLAFVLSVYIVVQCIESWILTPKIMGDRTGLHPGVIIFAIFFWGTALNGIMGMILAIPLTAFFVTFWRLLKRKYFATEKIESSSQVNQT